MRIGLTALVLSSLIATTAIASATPPPPPAHVAAAPSAPTRAATPVARVTQQGSAASRVATTPATPMPATVVPRIVPGKIVLAHGTPSALDPAPAAAPAKATTLSPLVRPKDIAPETYVRNGVRDPSRDGSNGGQWFKDSRGGDWFGKPGKGDAMERDRMGNEHAMSRIYKVSRDAFGTEAPELRYATIDGKAYLMSKKIALSETHSFDSAQMKRFGDGFVIDAWLANWDIGGDWQLVADTSGKMVRVDGGGGGLFRARGEPKGAQFGEVVGELQSMRDPSRPISAGFRNVSDQDVKQQLVKFAAWYPEHKGEIDAAIDGTTMSPAAATELKSKLAARAQWLINQAAK